MWKRSDCVGQVAQFNLTSRMVINNPLSRAGPWVQPLTPSMQPYPEGLPPWKRSECVGQVAQFNLTSRVVVNNLLFRPCNLIRRDFPHVE